MRGSLTRAVILTLMVMVVGCAGERAERVSVRDVVIDPTKYLGVRVQLRGETRVSVIDEPPNRGTYELMDDGDQVIKVRTRNLPAPGEVVVVDAQVVVETGNAVAHLREVSRCRAEGVFSLCDFNVWGAAVVVAAVVVAGLVAVLILVLLKPEAAASVGGAVTQVFRRAGQTQRIGVVPGGAASVEVVSGPGDIAGRRFSVRQRTSFGREDADVNFSDPTVSRQHAYIVYEGGGYRLVNQSNTNPTQVNGSVVIETKTLNDGDELTMGSIKLRFAVGR
ncbi:MAG TPA: FHA domain-containing protein [Terriglobales bacterium]|nr:FHA domain-containing protein [Terriglobales bacterium]